MLARQRRPKRTKTYRLIGYCAGLVLLALAAPASALQLSFDQSNYVINGNGGTATVSVYATLTPADPIIDINNVLLNGAIDVSYTSTTVAAPLNVADILAGPKWDFSSFGLQPTHTTIAVFSFDGISDLSQPLLLGQLIFHPIGNGTVTIQAMTLTPGPSFETLGGNIVDPINAPSATIQVNVPEPATASCAALGVGLLLARRRRTAINLHAISRRRT
jgi:hypothetical protein